MIPAIDLPAASDAHLIRRLREILRTGDDHLKATLNRNPLQSLVGLVLAGAAVFYRAEKGRNEKVVTFADAVDFVATCASVGYSNIFPATPVGRLVASTLFILGPSLAAKTLDQSRTARDEGPALSPGEQAIVAKLEELVDEVRRQGAGPGPAGSL
jgi:hypothetical protein